MTHSFKVGDDVYLKAADAVFDGMTGKTAPRDLSGPFVVERVYKCGNHWRLAAGVNGFTRVDAAVGSFEPVDPLS